MCGACLLGLSFIIAVSTIHLYVCVVTTHGLWLTCLPCFSAVSLLLAAVPEGCVGHAAALCPDAICIQRDVRAVEPRQDRWQGQGRGDERLHACARGDVPHVGHVRRPLAAPGRYAAAASSSSGCGRSRSVRRPSAARPVSRQCYCC